jgi:hypothetical protein
MANAPYPSFDAYRTGAAAALQLLVQQQQWREHALKLLQRRTERDRAALEGTLESLRHAQDWSDFAAASQSVWREYLGASAALWQEGAAAALQGTGAWTDFARDMTQQWQDSLGSLQSGAAGAKSGAAMPMREWMAAFERAVGVAAQGAAQAAQAAQAAAAAAASGAVPGAGGARTGRAQAQASGGQHER